MEIEHVYIQAVEGSPEDEAFHKAWHGFRKRGIACSLVDTTVIENGGLPLSRATIVAGGIPAVESAMREIGMPAPTANNLPDELSQYFGRTVTKTTLGNVRSEWRQTNPENCFLKPLNRNKQSPAIALFDVDDLLVLEAHSDSTEVIVSEYVLFESEWRVYVVNREIIGLSHYQGDCFVFPNPTTLKSAIRDFSNAPAGYGIDFGFLSSGETVLIEANDGYSLGSYGLNSVDCSRMTEARWAELAA